MTPRQRRAAPLPPDERRAAIIAATLPLLREHGAAVTTRQIAEAAGIAEGTIFRAFPDKETLVREAITAGFDPSTLHARLAEIDMSLDLPARLEIAVALVQTHLRKIFRLMGVMGMIAPPGEDECGPEPPRPPEGTSGERALQSIFDPDRDKLRCPPTEAARFLRLITFSGTHPGITDGEPLTPREIVSLLLDGIRNHPPESSPDHGTKETVTHADSIVA